MKLRISDLNKIIGSSLLTLIISILTKDIMEEYSTLLLTLAILGLIYIIGQSIYDSYIKVTNKKKASTNSDLYMSLMKHINDASQRLQVFKEGSDSGNPKYTKYGVLEKINEIRKAMDVFYREGCPKHLKNVLYEEGDRWLDDIEQFGFNVKRIKEKIKKAAIKDKI